jgi:hypothetical protein
MSTAGRPHFGIMTAPMQVGYDDILRVWQEADTIPEIEHAVGALPATVARWVTDEIIGAHAR